MAARYEIKGRLGRGGVGAVYQAYDHHLERDVAIKRLLPLDKTKLNQSAESTLQLEAKALAKLSHPNVVTIFEFGEDERGPYVVCELIDGDTLKVLIKEGALSVVDFYEVASQILDALVAAQEIDILHRDIKPANIMLSWLPSGKFQVKILDFGLSKFSEKPTKQTTDQKGAFLGSIDYIAPEQLEMLPLDQRTDLYSLGCVLYFALTQRPPFAGGSPAETSTNHLRGRVIPIEDMRPDLPKPVCRWLMRMLSNLPGDRPDNALKALEELQAARDAGEKKEPTEEEKSKVVVPVVEVAQPTNQPRVLEYTQQIITGKSVPMMPRVVPPHPNSQTSSVPVVVEVKKKKKKEPAPPKKSPLKAVALVSIAVLLLAAGSWIAISESLRNTLLSSSPRIASFFNSPDSNSAPEKKPQYRQYQNRGLMPVKVPHLPVREKLVAYFSVNGPVQDRNGNYLDFKQKPLPPIGAFGNMAPHAHANHLLKVPDESGRSPRFGNNWENYRTLIFSPGEKLITPQRAFNGEEVVSDCFTIAMLYRVEENSGGHLFKLRVDDDEGITHNRALFISFSPKEFRLGTGNENKFLIRTETKPRRYRLAIIEIDTANSKITLQDRSKNSPRLSPSIKEGAFDIPGPLSLNGYELGNLILMKNKSLNQNVEIPAFSIHSDKLSEEERTLLAEAMVEGAFPR